MVNTKLVVVVVLALLSITGAAITVALEMKRRSKFEKERCCISECQVDYEIESRSVKALFCVCNENANGTNVVDDAIKCSVSEVYLAQDASVCQTDPIQACLVNKGEVTGDSDEWQRDGPIIMGFTFVFTFGLIFVALFCLFYCAITCLKFCGRDYTYTLI